MSFVVQYWNGKSWCKVRGVEGGPWSTEDRADRIAKGRQNAPRRVEQHGGAATQGCVHVEGRQVVKYEVTVHNRDGVGVAHSQVVDLERGDDLSRYGDSAASIAREFARDFCDSGTVDVRQVGGDERSIIGRTVSEASGVWVL